MAHLVLVAPVLAVGVKRWRPISESWISRAMICQCWCRFFLGDDLEIYKKNGMKRTWHPFLLWGWGVAPLKPMYWSQNRNLVDFEAPKLFEMHPHPCIFDLKNRPLYKRPCFFRHLIEAFLIRKQRLLEAQLRIQNLPVANLPKMCSVTWMQKW